MRMFKIVLSGLLILQMSALYGQQTIVATGGDDLVLEADSFQGSIQWQESTDGNGWEDIAEANTSPYTLVLVEFPMYYRAKIDREDCTESHYSEEIEVISESNLKLWSDPETWNGTKPVEGDEVVIEEGDYILLDEIPPSLGGLTIHGTLEFDNKDLELTSQWIMVHGGTLRVGSESAPFTNKAIITLNDTNTERDVMGMGTRGIMVMGGSLELHGITPDVLKTKINAHGEAGSTSLELVDEVGWKTDDEIAIGPTDYYEAGFGASVTQRVALNSVDGNTLSLSEGLNAFRWGLLQYATNTGMSLTATDLVQPPAEDTETTTTPLVLDERAPLGLLTRNIVIQAPEDDLWNDIGFGVHTMIMPDAQAHIEGVEFKRAGQRGRLRRYAFHWHMLSYLDTQTLEDATGQYFNRNSINSSANRGVVIHGTNGVSVQSNIIYDVRGHGIFTEDASERRNTIDNNLVMHIRNPPWGTELKQHEQGEKGASGYWISNPDNTVTNNVAADCGTFGFWLAFPEQPWGESISVLHTDGILLRPNRLEFGVFDNNTSHSNKRDGIMLDDAEIDNEGNTSGKQYYSTTEGREPIWPFETLRRFALSRYKTWKNGDNGIWDRSTWPDNYEVVAADNCGRFFAGAGADGLIERSLVVGTSLNHLMNNTGRPGFADFYDDNPGFVPSAFATYHSSFGMQDNIIVNFPLVEGERSGAFATEDYYIRPVEKGHFRNTNNLLINSHPGYKMEARYNYYTLASVLWDPHGLWGPSENYFVYNDPFLTYGKEVIAVEPGDGSGGVSVSGPFYGFEGFVLNGIGDTAPNNQPYFDLMGLRVRRLDQNFNHVATWEVNPATPDLTLNHMRDFATDPNGFYELTFPWESAMPTDFQMNVENMLETSDTQVMAIQYDGALSPVVQMLAYQFYEEYAEVSSIDEVISSEGATWWQDKGNNLVWVKMRGGIWQFWTEDENEAAPTGDDLLYETTQLRVYVPE